MSQLQLNAETIVRPGHMDQTTIGFERRTNPFVLQALAERRVEDLPLTPPSPAAPVRRALPEDDLFEAPARRRA